MSSDRPALPPLTSLRRPVTPFLLLAIVLHGAALAYPLTPPTRIAAPPILTATLTDQPASVTRLAEPQPPPAQARPKQTPLHQKIHTPPAKPQILMAGATPTPDTPRHTSAAVTTAALAEQEPANTGAASSKTVITTTPGKVATLTTARFDAAYLNNPRPHYPNLSRRLGEEGKVLLRVRVGTDGQPLTVQLEKSSDFVRLDDAALQVVGRWRFIPAKRGDEAIEATVIVPIVFQLES